MRVGPNLKLFLFPSLTLVILIFLFVNLVQKGYSQIIQKYQVLKDLQRNEKTLEQKISQLREIPQSVIDNSELSLIALPEKNPSTLALSQIKGLIADKSIVLLKFNTSKEVSSNSSDQSKVKLRINADFGDLPLLIDYLKAIKKVLPLLIIDEIKIENGENKKEFNLSILVYYSSLPKTLSKISEPVKQFTQSEIRLLEQLSEYTAPKFVVIQPVLESDRDNAFR